MDNNVLVSVIVPVYNVAPYLAESLESVIHQSYKNLEIIIIDDGSTDGSGHICDKYAHLDKRIYVLHQDNRGLSAARNAGLEMMTGKYVAFLDSDDLYQYKYIEEMVAVISREDVDLVICNYSTYQKNDNNIDDARMYPRISEGSYNQAVVLQALANHLIDHVVWNKLYNKKLWNKTRFPVGHVYEDADITYKIFNQCETVYVLDKSLCIGGRLVICTLVSVVLFWIIWHRTKRYYKVDMWLRIFLRNY